jgi:hypothetical protein
MTTPLKHPIALVVLLLEAVLVIIALGFIIASHFTS